MSKSKNGKSYVKMTKCPRCGLTKRVSKHSVVLCPDCRYVLSKAEQMLWEEKVAA